MPSPSTTGPGSLLDRAGMLVLTLAAVGCAVLGFQHHGEPFAWALLAGVPVLAYWQPHRARGISAWAALPLFLFTLFDWSAVAQGVFAGLAVAGVVRSGFYFPVLFPNTPCQPNRLPLSIAQQMIVVGGGMMLWTSVGDPARQPWLSLGLFLGLWVWCPRPTFEMLCEPILRFFYRIRWAGPGARQLPPTGPLLVIANHGCWFDPMIMGKLLYRPMTPMMTSRFFGIWYLRPLLKYIFRVIVVPDVERRKEAPELKDAAAALNRGECVLIFPEGYLRRDEAKPLRLFGRGTWMILQECKEIPVLACWIEGGWGSWGSYFNGPPTVNKAMDRGRQISVGMAAPEVIPPEVLADQMRTRLHLMNMVSAARAHVGLDPLPRFELPSRGEKSEE